VYDGEYTYSLVYVDDDDIPELLVQMDNISSDIYFDYSFFHVVTAYNNRIYYDSCLKGWDGTISYIERNGLVCMSYVYSVEKTSSAYFSEDVSKLQDGNFSTVFHGYCDNVTAEREDLYGTAEYRNDGEDLTYEEYMSRLNAVYDTSAAVTPEFVSKEEIIAQIESY
ncbi:MAG: hypothetical protein LUC83_10320, partial [Clostridiales bacterium]|nr:hypothetical protein [Clostridiales bacterium]